MTHTTIIRCLAANLANKSEKVKLNDIFRIFDRWCKENQKLIVLIIDEVDTAASNQVFLDFLGKLRSNYLKRQKNTKYRTFQSVILAGVTDVSKTMSLPEVWTKNRNTYTIERA